MAIQRDPFNHSAPLYEKYCLEISSYLKDYVIKALRERRQQNEINFLREWPVRFENHRLVEKGLADMFTYLVCLPTLSVFCFGKCFELFMSSGSILHSRQCRDVRSSTSQSMVFVPKSRVRRVQSQYSRRSFRAYSPRARRRTAGPSAVEECCAGLCR
jgi:hypothetical protein